MGTKKSQSLLREATKLIPGGVNSPVRAFSAVGSKPLFIKKASGARVTDADNNTYIDYVGSWGPMIVGHANPKVGAALKRAIDRGTSYGAPTESEITLAKMVIEAMPAMEMVRFVSSGTEATMSAIRLARGVTGRDRILKFEGCYHGHADSLLVKAGSGAATLGMPSSPGVPKSLAKETYNAIYNDLGSVEKIFKKDPKGISCIIVEGIPGNMGVVPPVEGFMKGLKKICKKYGALLIVDEVMSGFRLCYGGAHQTYDIVPDLVCLGKVIGGGLPVGAFGGRASIMKQLSPTGPVYQAGTLSGNPIAMTAGIETLKILAKRGQYKKLFKLTDALTSGIAEIAARRSVESCVVKRGSMFTLFFTAEPPQNFTEVCKADLKKFAKYFRRMLSHGIYIAPSAFEASFMSLAHTDKDIAKTLEAVDKSFTRL
ncbi:MAG: glutamate-1-semialdehyde 2,1-aminomutase [Proteobacteria bacterium]|nr:glutamate-1-semialdehyde 2,1-aminomutase [Pseudomonadota bacterium]